MPNWYTAGYNPVVGCKPISAGCNNCTGVAPLLGGRTDPRRVHLQPAVEECGFGGAKWSGEVVETPLNDGLRQLGTVRSKPQRVMVGPSCDLFYEGVSDAAVRGAVEIMTGPYRRHTFLILTKRPGRMAHFLAGLPGSEGKAFARLAGNLWWGVSVEDQANADARVPELLRIDSPNLFAACEPLLGPVDLRRWLTSGASRLAADPRLMRALRGRPDTRRLGWVVIGGEVYRAARPCDLNWVAGLVRQCWEAKAPAWLDRLGQNVIGFDGSPLDIDLGDQNAANPDYHSDVPWPRQLPKGMP